MLSILYTLLLLTQQPAGQLTPWIFMGGIGMTVVAIAFTVYALRRGGTWAYLGLGALAWVVTVAVKFAIAIPINPILYKAIFDESNLWAPGSVLMYVYIGSLTGWTEVLLSWFLLRYTRLGQAPWRKAVGFGIGFGAVEALLLGLLSLMQMLAVFFATSSIPSETLQSYMMMNNPLNNLAPIIERIATIGVHVLCCVLIFLGARTKQARWMWIAFAAKTFIDSVAAYAQLRGLDASLIWTIEAIISVFGLICWWGIRQVAKRYPKDEEPAAIEPLPVPAI